MLKEIINKIKGSKYNKFIKLIFHLGFIISILVKVFYVQYSGKYNLPPFNQEVNNRMLWATFFTILILYSIIQIISFNKTELVLLISNILISILFLADVLYSRYYGMPLGINIILTQMGVVGDISSSVITLIRIKDIIFLIDIPIFIVVLIVISKTKKINWITKISISVSLFIIGVLGFRYIYKDVNHVIYNYERRSIVKDLGVLYYHYYDVKDYIKVEFSRDKSLSEEEYALITDYFYEQTVNEFTGIAKDMNILVIQLEAMQEFVINRTIEGQAITPNINSLIEESIYFNNLYNQVGSGNTSDAEMILNNSLFGYGTGSTYFMFPNNYFSSLGNKLKDNGYETMMFHAYEPSFWNRINIYRNLGFNRFYNIRDYEMTEKKGWSLSDKEFFRQSLDFIEEQANGNPFYGHLITLSTHHPYDAFIHDDFNVGKYQGSMLGNFIKGANYADQAIGLFLEELKERGLYDNTLIVMYGDHSALFEDQASNLFDYLGTDYSHFKWEKLQKVTGLIHIPNDKRKILVDDPAGKIDLLPTIANLMNLEMPYMLGRDTLSDTENPFVIRRNGTLITNEYLYSSQTGSVYDINTGEKLPIDLYREVILGKQEKLRVSDLILKKDAIRQIIKNGD
ncbi:phosphoglycerol transferase MdoB-like AlkP superfamily enzyme [Natranaerovirga pectinivora]|uniref:Phosphoglycerol transferase MdoB-like AlkP superfamily enzyme n=1 Tax=Natranaerovirga pectinivora TaxID=682400 RepID=A0A4R3MPJ4_9FIRM|nr:LTA synthase family protein [Natranaerovirga pectinivora]TCT14108.1 phosphoglycerol transferase MdoB-like AlkP superfamily enzyme [Natranaerovirga pectinivora]